MTMEHSEKTSGYDHRLAGSKLRESICEWDLGLDIVPSLSLDYHIRRVMMEVHYILVRDKSAFIYLDIMFKAIFNPWH